MGSTDQDDTRQLGTYPERKMLCWSVRPSIGRTIDRLDLRSSLGRLDLQTVGPSNGLTIDRLDIRSVGHSIGWTFDWLDIR